MKPALAVLFLALPALAAEPAEMINKATCTKGAETRELEITAKGEGHTVTYTKKGTAKEVGTCSTNKEKCQAVFDNLKTNLEKAGFACKI
ncbi:MAG: hypothetical protein JST04_00390 [Bdellovibrionales bacterium]|nr:hypothetical protein [Bdellovibrionales bacterium]